ncbi:MAG: YccF family protein [Rhodobacteraceae bacterium]|nr:YccF family protein [Paracoccaceae bacterium]
MRFAGNVIWFVIAGAPTALFWLLGAALFALSIVGLPLTRAAFEMAKLTAWPFGKDVVHIRELDGKELSAKTAVTGTIGLIFNLLWACSFGIFMFIYYILIGVFFCATIILIPFGLQCFKLAGLSLWPVGRRVVDSELATLARTTNAQARLDRMRA